MEKLPLLLPVVVVVLLTIQAQGASGSIRSSDELGYVARLANVPVAYVRYLALTFWPEGLACFYPHPAVVDPNAVSLASGAFLGALGLLATITAGAVVVRRSHPEILIGWLWFLGMLVPVIGLLQVGAQAYADRYTYLPSIGLGIAIVWPLWKVSCRSRVLAIAGGSAVVLVTVLLWGRTRAQCATWESSETLFAHALAVTEKNYKAHNSYGVVLEARGEFDEARGHYEAALEIRPKHVQALTNLGKVLAGKGELDRCEELFRQAIELDPRAYTAMGNLGAVRLNRGDLQGGIAYLEQALEVKEDHALHHHNLGLALRMARRPEEAEVHLKRAAELDPRYAKR